jgi:hypothetical protein
MRRTFFPILVAVIACFAASAKAVGPATITVATWNIECGGNLIMSEVLGKNG